MVTEKKIILVDFLDKSIYHNGMTDDYDDEFELGQPNQADQQNQVSKAETIHRYSHALAKANLMQQLHREIPRNASGLPEYILRCDLIPHDLRKMHVVDFPTGQPNHIEHTGTLHTPPPKALKDPQATLSVDTINQLSSHIPQKKKTARKIIPLTEAEEEALEYEVEISELSEPGYTPQDEFRILNNASIMLDYSEGYPVQLTGEPFWAKLPYEPPSAYNSFIAYLGDENSVDGSSVTNRHLASLSKRVNKPIASLYTDYHLYCWRDRAQAYDIYVVAAHVKLKEQRAVALENSHYTKAGNILELVTAQVMTKLADADKGEDVSIKDLTALMTLAMKTQRVSAGLSHNGAAQAPTQAPGTSLAVTFKESAEKTNGDESGSTGQLEDDRELFEDEDALAKAQELIIHMNPKT